MRNLLILALCALCTLFSACNTSSGSNNSNPKIRYVNVTPVLGTVSVNAGGSAVGTVPSPGSSGYKEIGSGSQEIKIQSPDGASTYIDTTLAVASPNRYSYVIFGDDTSTLAVQLLDEVAGPGSGNIKLRVLNVATGLGPVDMYLVGAGTDINSVSANLSSIPYTTVQGFGEYAGGSLRFVLTAAGSKTIIYDSGVQSLPAGLITTAVVYSTASGRLPAVAFLPTDDPGSSSFVNSSLARFKFVQGAISVASANVQVDNNPTLSGVPYTGISAYGIYASGSRNIKVESSTAPGAPLADTNVTLTGGKDYSLVATSNLGTGAVSLLALQDNNLPPAISKAKLRVVNAVSDGGAYDVYSNFLLYLSNLASGTASKYQQVDPGTYNFAFNPAGTGPASATLTTTVSANAVYTLYLVGKSGQLTAVLSQDY
jgi:hypothetical protein